MRTSTAPRSPSSLTPIQASACAAFDADILAHTPLFGGMDDDCRCVLTDRMEIRSVARGTTLFAEGDTARELFILADGGLDVRKKGQSLGPLKHGDFFGEGSFLDTMPRGTTVVCTADATVYAIPYPALRDLYRHNVRAYALIVMNIARELSRRLRCADDLACGKSVG